MRVTLSDGTEINGLRMLWNTNIFVSEKPINKGTFQGNLETVIVGADNHRERDTICHNMELVKFEECTDYQPPEWHFELAPKEVYHD